MFIKVDLGLRLRSIWLKMVGAGVVVLVVNVLRVSGPFLVLLRRELMNAPLKVGLAACFGGFIASV